jgi:hypothetical protein
MGFDIVHLEINSLFVPSCLISKDNIDSARHDNIPEVNAMK